MLANDSRLEGGPVLLAGVNQPAHGTVTTNADGSVIYAPASGYSGNDSFTYSVTSSAGGSANAIVSIEVVNPVAATGAMLVEYWHNISGGSVSGLTGNANFPNNPTVKYYTNSAFELRSNYGDNYGSRVRTLLIPSASGSYTFSLLATDVNGQRHLAYNITLGVAAMSVSPGTDSLPPPVSGVAYTQTISAAGGTPPYTFRLAYDLG